MQEGAQLPYLATFLIAAETSSFTATANSLALTQAAVSQRIAALEQSLGISLFDRRGGRVALTEAGKRLHVYADQILELHRSARKEISGRDLTINCELLIAASSVPGEYTCFLSCWVLSVESIRTSGSARP